MNNYINLKEAISDNNESVPSESVTYEGTENFADEESIYKILARAKDREIEELKRLISKHISYSTCYSIIC